MNPSFKLRNFLYLMGALCSVLLTKMKRGMVLATMVISAGVLSSHADEQSRIPAGGEPSAAKPLVLDMVHHNPGEPLYESAFEDPAVLKEMGFNGKVYFLFDSPTLAITWESVDPDIFPKGSPGRAWVDAKAARIKEQHAACRAAGIATYAMADMILLPKALVVKRGMQKTFGNVSDPQVQQLLRAQIDEMFAQFPDLDGLVVRVGETYLHDAPYHMGKIRAKNNTSETIIPLINLLREEICIKRNKQLIFRTWLSFAVDSKDYLEVSDDVEPHPNLVISIKHVEGDFHRATPFSKVFGIGRHRQLIEVQCAREYEGKGAYPNYIARGVIEGFEEHAQMPNNALNSMRGFVEKHPDLYAGVWTWTRGGGWGGPYIRNELWCDVNAWVMAQWAKDPAQTEEAVLNRYATTRLKLSDEDARKFRRLCLLSADAVVRGRNSTHGDMNEWWTRDIGIGWPGVIKDKTAQARNLKQKDESVAMWKEIVELAEAIRWADTNTRDFAIASAHYGLGLFEIYRALVYLADAEARHDPVAIQNGIKVYDQAWHDYKELPATHPAASTLYDPLYSRNIKPAHRKVTDLREKMVSDQLDSKTLAGESGSDTLLAIPGSLQAAGDEDTVTLTWNAAHGAAKYTIQRATQSGGPYQTLAEDITATTYTDSAVVRNQDFFYVVVAENATGITGSPSREVRANSGLQQLKNASFEHPIATSILRNPLDADWDFPKSGRSVSGITPGFSPVTSANGNPPDGTQVAYLQGTSSMSQELVGLTPQEKYRITFFAAQRANKIVSGQTWDVQIDGKTIASFAPPAIATSYHAYHAEFTATAPRQTLSFVGTNKNGGDNTVFIDQVEFVPVP